MKHFYKKIGENWFSSAKYYKDMVERVPDGGTILELGCWKGRSTACLGVEIINSEKDITLFCVDPWQYFPKTEQPVSNQQEFDEVFEQFCENTKPFNEFMYILKDVSSIASLAIEDETIDFMFIDASHYYEDVKLDIELWLPKIKKGGTIAGHDYFTSVHPGVKQAVDEHFPKVKTIPEQNVWYYEK